MIDYDNDEDSDDDSWLNFQSTPLSFKKKCMKKKVYNFFFLIKPFHFPIDFQKKKKDRF